MPSSRRRYVHRKDIYPLPGGQLACDHIICSLSKRLKVNATHPSRRTHQQLLVRTRTHPIRVSRWRGRLKMSPRKTQCMKLLAGTADPDEHHRKSSAIQKNSRRRHTGGGRRSGSRSAPTQKRRLSVVVHAASSLPGSPGSPGSSPGSPMSPGSPGSPTMNLSRVFSTTGASRTKPASVANAVMRMGSIGSGSIGPRASLDGIGRRNSQVMCVPA